MTKLRDIAVCLLLIAALAFGLVSWSQYKTAAQLRADLQATQETLATEQKLRKADVSSLTTRLQLAEKARIEKGKRDDATHQAVAANPLWSSERVPDAVVDALGM